MHARSGWRRGGHLCRVAGNTVWSYWQVTSRSSEVNFTKNYTLLYLSFFSLNMSTCIITDLSNALQIISFLTYLNTVNNQGNRTADGATVSKASNRETGAMKRHAEKCSLGVRVGKSKRRRPTAHFYSSTIWWDRQRRRKTEDAVRRRIDWQFLRPCHYLIGYRPGHVTDTCLYISS